MNSKKILTITLITLLIAGLLWTTKPWQKLGREGNSRENQQGENVLFAYQATFTYENSKHQQPLENVGIWVLAPNIDNEISSKQLGARGWMLEYIDNENQIWLETSYDAINDNKTTYKLKRNRTKELEITYGPGFGYITSSKVTTASKAPVFEYRLSELYPGEQFTFSQYAVVDNEDADNLTLQVVGENQKSLAGYYWPKGDAENKKIDLYFDVKLMRPVSENQVQVIERFVRRYENGGSSWYWLYPPQG